MSSDAKDIGQIAYEGYYRNRKGVTHTGAPMPLWSELPLEIMWAWGEAALMVRRNTLAEVIALLKGEQA
ncbi:hypothetical protein DAERI_060129 [Deinococcus aerius]|uniref:Uncharacterized protein n=1 Tax=Deinococcus aerius TaxID=200253 RepID=A0A2I9CVB9_9DEIO|nr:hypothetical protein [Deinococcus aerius]GBF05869.1 hypothetical protein DAERI_060129 [Deinococcus aerius]